MATVTALADRVCSNTGLQTTGTERALVIEALNDANRTACRLSRCNETSASYTFVSSADDYSISSTLSLTDVLSINSITYNDGAYPVPLTGITEDAMLDLRISNAAAGYTRYYSTMGLDTLMFYPQPASGDSITIRYSQRPDTLVESAPGAGQESTPTAVPVEFHWSVLAAGAEVTSLLLDQRRTDVGDAEQRYQAGLAQLKAHVESFMPTRPAYAGMRSASFSSPDQRRRG